MATDAKAYKELSEPQYEMGCAFIDEQNIVKGSRVLDMGCGTGEISKYISDLVGCEGHIVGIDPDETRIKLAQENYKDVKHLQFFVSDSVKGFPHEDEPYYDFHVSTSAFHWLPHDHKKIYLKKVFNSLKPDGKLAILCGIKLSFDKVESKNVGLHMLSLDEFRKLFDDVGFFPNAVVNVPLKSMHFKSEDAFKRWFKASTQHEIEEMGEDAKAKGDEMTTYHDDGSMTIRAPFAVITASKS